MQSGNRTKDSVKTTEISFSILEHLVEAERATLTDISNKLEIAKSTAHRHLSTLRSMEYVVQQDHEYEIGARFLRYAERVKSRESGFKLAETKVKQLADQTDERAQFIIEEFGLGIYLHTTLGQNAVKTTSGIGQRMPLHCIAAGKAILSEMPKSSVEAIIEDRGLPSLTEHTITNPKKLFEELEVSRDQGFALNRGESTIGLNAVGVPIKKPTGTPLGALSIAGPTNRLPEAKLENELSSKLLGVANEIELEIEYA